MKRSLFNLCRASLMVGIIMLTSGLSSCINDDQSDCGLDLRFRYTYNVKDADAFSSEVKNVNVFAFGEDGKLVNSYTETSDKFGADYVMNIRGLKAGKYTFVCLARNSRTSDDAKDFVFASMTPGQSTIDDLNERLSRNADNVCDSEIAALYTGETEVSLTDEPQSAVISLMKCTNTMRVIIMPYTSGDTQLNADNFDISIEGSAGWLNRKGDKYQDDPLVYRPFSIENAVSDNTTDGSVDRAVVADLNTSRIFRDANPRLVVKDKRTGTELADINLAWFLSLQGIGEHRDEWSDQEYLDRQDNYSITFFVDGDRFMMGKIIVNGWVLNLIDATI